MLRGGKRKMRRSRTEAEALATLDAMLVEYADQLGYFYSMPRPYRIGEGRRVYRRGISPGVRFAVFERDGFRCAYCGSTSEETRLVIDHVTPVADGGSAEPENLTTACVACNAGKADKPLLNVPVRLSRPA